MLSAIRMTWSSPKAVSYTHLDVYKRQLLPVSAITAWAEESGSNLKPLQFRQGYPVLDGITPVSYTHLYATLVTSMVAGRLVWGAVRFVLAGLSGSSFPFSAFLSGAVLTAVPGIVAQLILIPLIVAALQKAKLTA